MTHQRAAASTSAGPAATLAILALLAGGCSAAPPGPVDVDTRNDACRHCRMSVSDLRFAAQIVAPQEEPLFFDDVGCLRDYLNAHPDRPPGARVFVSDFQRRTWIPADQAVYWKSTIATPMGSGLVAFGDAGAAAAAGLSPGEALLSAEGVFGTTLRNTGPR